MNFVIVVDSDKERRSLFIKKIETLLSPVEGLVTSLSSSKDFCAIWAAGSWAPVSCINNNKGVAIIWGDAIVGPGPERLNAEQLRQLWANMSDNLPDALDGFHAAVVYNPKKGIVVGADLLGVFPIYYYVFENLVLVGSSPELFRYHPCFRTELNPAGLVGILLTKGLVDGQTLLQGVNRLAAGHLLVRHYEEPVREVKQYEVPVSNRHLDLSPSEQVNVLDKAFEETVTRHVLPDIRHCLMLSGGLDSRTIAAYLKRKNRDIIALTEGLPTDNEMKCATKVAKSLGIQHHMANVGFDDYLRLADLAAKWEHLASGFTNLMFWGLYPYLRQVAQRVVSGYLCDIVLGGGVNAQASFESFFEDYLSSWGFRPEILKGLLKQEYFGEVVSEVLDRVKEVYGDCSGSQFHCIRRFMLYHRGRFHVGSIIWLLSFGAWPVVPVIDRRFLEVAGGLPIMMLENRRAEKELLCAKFPELAKLPIERFTYDITPLIPTIQQKITHYVYGDGSLFKFSRRANLLRNMMLGLGGARRYYYRTSDFNGPGWRKIRQQTERHQKHVFNLFDEDAFHKLVPPSNANLGFENPVHESAKLKSLVGFSLWMHNHLS